MKTIDIICPVYHEEEVIGVFHERLVAVVERLADRYRARVLYVVDPSPDRTEAILRDVSAHDARVSIIVMSRRFGHQAALIAGMDHSDSDAVIMLDSDLQHPPELIPALIERWENGAEIVQTIRQDGAQTAFAKRLTSLLFYQTLLKVGSIELTPGAADYRLISNRVVSVFRTQMREHNPFLRGLVSWVGFNVCFVPFVPAGRGHGRSKYGASALINFALNGICSFSNLPLRLCIGAGFVIAVLSLLGGSLQLLFYFLGSLVVPGWASLFMFGSFIGGIQLVFLGILGEYVSLIFDEVKDRPRYIVNRLYESGRIISEQSLRDSTTCRGATRDAREGATRSSVS
jgi:polyisoprenyl-phosphate glycosyltransferase